MQRRYDTWLVVKEGVHGSKGNSSCKKTEKALGNKLPGWSVEKIEKGPGPDHEES